MVTRTTEILEILKQTVIPGGIILKALKGKLVNNPKKSDLPKDMADSMSTAHRIGDDLVQEVALQILQSHGKDFRINAEESTQRISLFKGTMNSYCYHLDPLDGTFSFLNEKDGYCVGAAFSKNLRFEAGALYFPAKDRIFLAQRGKGIIVETSTGGTVKFERKTLADAKFIQRRCEEYIPIADELGLTHLSTMGAHHGMLSVAMGDAKFLMYKKASPHDFGIPQVLVEEAGGVCTDFEGNTVSYDIKFNRVPLFLAFYDDESKKQFFEAKEKLNL